MLRGKELAITLSLLNDFLSTRPQNLIKVILIKSSNLELSKYIIVL